MKAGWIARGRRLLRLGFLCWVGLLTSGASAHLMVAQHGTLNWAGSGAFLVVSLPVSAFSGVDDDGDGLWTPAELQRHWQTVERQVVDGVRLHCGSADCPLQGLMLQLSPEHGATASSQLVVLGRFDLSQAPASPAFDIRLKGARPEEQQLRMTLTRGDETQVMLLSPQRHHQQVFPPAWQVAMDYLSLGLTHILTGPDHLLFLAVVLLGGGPWRVLVAVFSAFTLGHALTLTAALWGWVQAPPELVEPAIAATILGMAALEAYQRRRGQVQPLVWRLSLVMACALIHGLGLASALGERGLDHRHLGWSLLSFNLGIELGQLLCAALFLGGIALVRPLVGPGAQRWATHAFSLLAVGLGGWWCVERLGWWV